MSSTGLGNPVATLYREVWDEHATWTDALFWYAMGAISVAVIWWSTIG